MASYDNASVDRMRREAIARVRDMQRKAQGYANEPADSVRESHRPAEKQSDTHREHHTENQEHSKRNNSSIGGLLNSILGTSGEGFDIDEEKALIALLIYVLYKNGADVKLMLALGYLLL